MRANVVIQRCGARERPLAVAAFEWLLAGMHDGVVAQVIWVIERLVAVAAVVGLMGHARAYMNMQN